MFSVVRQVGLRFFSSLPKKTVITFTDSALECLRNEIKLDKSLFVSIRTGGCAGLRLNIEHIKSPGEVDISQGFVKVFTDTQTAEMLQGAIIGYEDTLIKSGFVINHPSIKGTCGCNDSYIYDFNALGKRK